MDEAAPRIEGDPPDSVSLRTAAYAAGTRFPRKGQPWGELNYALSGVCEFVIAGRRYLSPPAYGLWIPPGVEHEAWNRHPIVYATFYVAAASCAGLPPEPRTLSVSPLLRTVVADFVQRGLTAPRSDADARLAQVIVDQIALAPGFDSYLPAVEDRLIAPIAEALRATPGARTSLAEWARQAGVSERTLSRRWRDAAGIGFEEWRQRLKLVTAVAMLDGGGRVREVAAALGYNDPSAFIAMFRRMAGSSPAAMARR